MKKTYFYLFTACILLLISCIDSVKLESIPVNNILVVNSLITTDSVFTCSVSRVYSINDTTDHSIKNAEVRIFDVESETLVCKLLHTQNGNYRAKSAVPVFDKEYRIEVSADGFQTISGVTTIPQQQKSTGVSVIPKAGFDPVADSDYSELRYTINDSYKGENFFEIQLSSFVKSGNDYVFNDGGYSKIEIEDSIYLIQDAAYYADYTINDAVLQYEDLIRYNPSSLVFSDYLFDGSMHNFTARCWFKMKKGSFFVLFTLSPELYHFRTSLMQHRYEMGEKGISRFDDLAGLDFSSKAIDVFSNIEGGYGVFAGYNTHTLYAKTTLVEVEHRQYVLNHHDGIVDTIWQEPFIVEETVGDTLADGREIFYFDQTENPL